MTVTSPCNVHESINVLKYYENWSRESQIGTMENNYAPWESHEQMSYMYMYHWFSRTHEQSHEQMSYMYHWLSYYNTTI